MNQDTGLLRNLQQTLHVTPMSDYLGAYNRYFGRLNTGKMKIRGMMARKG
ncbi:MAG: hypothetical protein ABR985_21460 [Methanotrichaceae archaeon]